MDCLDHKLMSVIDQLTRSARDSKIISLNMTLLAAQVQTGNAHKTEAIKVVAKEIQRLSNESSTGIATLQGILAEVRLLTHIINLSGRQRMLSQKIMKLFLILQTCPSAAADREFNHLQNEFEQALEQLRICRLNTPSIQNRIEQSMEVWSAFKSALAQKDLPSAITLNERVLTEMHSIVQHYEELSGTRAVA